MINTTPEQTLRAFAHHGEVARTLDADPDAAERTLADAMAAGVDLTTVTAELEREGVQSFCDSYHQLLGCLQRKLREVSRDASDAERWLDEGGSPGDDRRAARSRAR